MDPENWMICDTDFWDTDLFWNTEKPRLTSCFRQSVTGIIPSVILFALCILKPCLWCRQLIPDEKRKNSLTLLFIFKVIVSCLLIILQSTELVYLIYLQVSLWHPVPVISFLSASIRIIALVLALALQIHQRKTGQLNSVRLFAFWFFSGLLGFFMSPQFDLLTDAITESTDSLLFAVNSVSYSLILIEFVLSTFTDPSYDSIYNYKKDEYLIEHQPVLSRIYFAWADRLIFYGYKHAVNVDDMDNLSPERRSAGTYNVFQKHWSKELRKHEKSLDYSEDAISTEKTPLVKHAGKPSFLRALTKTVAPILLISVILELVYDFVIMLPPMILNLLISFVENESEPLWHGLAYAFCLFASSAFATLLMAQDLYFLVVASLLPKGGISSAIYRKLLRLSSGARKNYTVGELCNLLAVDSAKIIELLWGINLIWSSPLRIILCIALLWQYLGVATLAGVSVMVLIMPITALLASKTQKFQTKQMERKDWRLRQMGEMLSGIKILKLFAWELPFIKQITNVRDKEVSTIRKLAFLNAGVVFLWSSAPFLVAITSFVTFIFMDEKNILNPSIAFVSLTLFNNLRFAMSTFPQIVREVVESRVSFQRLQTFFLSEELNEEDIGSNVPEGTCIAFDNASFSWTKDEDPFLCDITAMIPKGSLIGIVGQVGAGKSALISSILGEMHKISGTINVKKEMIAYVAQQAWILNATVEENILFLKNKKSSFYNDVLEKCSLEDDLKILPSGDQTEIGEKGVTLSGGQKQRISLARALYQNADIYLFDDPLSAVDSHVGAHIFKRVIGPKGALRNKTRLLVTHDISILPDVDFVFVMEDGRITEIGTYHELMRENGNFAKFVQEHSTCIQEEEIEIGDTSSKTESIGEDVIAENLTPVELKAQMRRTGSRILSRTISATQDQPPPQKPKIRLIEDEKMESGNVKASVFFKYFRYATYTLIILMICSYIAYNGFEVGSNVWLSLWSTDTVLPDGSQDTELRNLRIGIYGLLGIGQGLCIFSAAILMAMASTRASKSLHYQMLMSILRSPMFFFERTPIGRILNRFGRDINVVDTNIPMLLDKLIKSILSVIATFALISANNPIFLGIMLPLGILYVLIQKLYLMTSRQVRRIISITMSPVMSNFSETAQGVSTIRAFKAQKSFIQKEDILMDINMKTFFCATVLNRWLSVRLELMGSIIVLITAIFAVTGRESISAGVVGLILTYALSVTESLAILVKMYTNLEMRMVSVERIAEYSELPSEAAWEAPGSKPPPRNWPKKGAISFKDYKMHYSNDTNLILRGININVLPKEKVGIVGRTGAGKSSLAIALFRVVEPCGGSILIDGIDIASLGLHDLRSKLTVIPQDPVLFSGPLRVNLDPLKQHSDEEVWKALEHAHLKQFVASLGEDLQYNVSEGGENLSVGQRQQLCLARALLKKTKILVLDEATAAVDMETDRLIQSTIRSEFDACTVLTIAHRLYTILDYDRIIVMDSGQIIEEGKPDDLLQRKDSAFYSLAKDAGLL